MDNSRALPLPVTPDTVSNSEAFACYFCKRVFTARHLLVDSKTVRCGYCRCATALAGSADEPVLAELLRRDRAPELRKKVRDMVGRWHDLAFPPLSQDSGAQTGRLGYMDIATNNRPLLRGADYAMCIYCRRAYEPKALNEWIGATAVCAHCHVDAVIPVYAAELDDHKKYHQVADWHRQGFSAAD